MNILLQNDASPIHEDTEQNTEQFLKIIDVMSSTIVNIQAIAEQQVDMHNQYVDEITALRNQIIQLENEMKNIENENSFLRQQLISKHTQITTANQISTQLSQIKFDLLQTKQQLNNSKYNQTFQRLQSTVPIRISAIQFQQRHNNDEIEYYKHQLSDLKQFLFDSFQVKDIEAAKEKIMQNVSEVTDYKFIVDNYSHEQVVIQNSNHNFSNLDVELVQKEFVCLSHHILELKAGIQKQVNQTLKLFSDAQTFVGNRLGQHIVQLYDDIDYQKYSSHDEVIEVLLKCNSIKLDDKAQQLLNQLQQLHQGTDQSIQTELTTEENQTSFEELIRVPSASICDYRAQQVITPLQDNKDCCMQTDIQNIFMLSNNETQTDDYQKELILLFDQLQQKLTSRQQRIQQLEQELQILKEAPDNTFQNKLILIHFNAKQQLKQIQQLTELYNQSQFQNNILKKQVIESEQHSMEQLSIIQTLFSVFQSQPLAVREQISVQIRERMGQGGAE